MACLANNPTPSVLSAFICPLIPGKLYIEAISEAHVCQALKTLSNVYVEKMI
jgi:Early transcription elongation factor of RNA pol II, NGN section